MLFFYNLSGIRSDTQIYNSALCARQLLDALKVDKKLKHDGRIHIWGFLKAGGMTVEDAMKWTFSTMTAYQNPEKEFGYNIRHAWGREGGGKGIGKDAINFPKKSFFDPI